jgi:hypothetical protein
MSSSKFNQTVNQFTVGDYVREKGKEQEMKITSNRPGGLMGGIGHYLKTDKFTCEWKDKEGNIQTGFFNGEDLESA